MKWIQEEDGRIVLSLERGETLRDSIESLAAELDLVAARVSAIGALEEPELGCYELDDREYLHRTFDGIWELLALEGNISLLDGEPFLHAHCSISGPDFDVRGGHLFDAKVGVVVEMFIEPFDTPLPRIPCEAIGLPRWEPGEDA